MVHSSFGKGKVCSSKSLRKEINRIKLRRNGQCRGISWAPQVRSREHIIITLAIGRPDFSLSSTICYPVILQCHITRFLVCKLRVTLLISQESYWAYEIKVSANPFLVRIGWYLWERQWSRAMKTVDSSCLFPNQVSAPPGKGECQPCSLSKHKPLFV